MNSWDWMTLVFMHVILTIEPRCTFLANCLKPKHRNAYIKMRKKQGFMDDPPRTASLQGSNHGSKHWLVDQWHGQRQFLARLNGNRLWSWFWTTVEIGGVSIKCINVKRQLGLNFNTGKFGIQSHVILYENILFLNGYFKISISNPRNEYSV